MKRLDAITADRSFRDTGSGRSCDLCTLSQFVNFTFRNVISQSAKSDGDGVALGLDPLSPHPPWISVTKLYISGERLTTKQV